MTGATDGMGVAAGFGAGTFGRSGVRVGAGCVAGAPGEVDDAGVSVGGVGVRGEVSVGDCRDCGDVLVGDVFWSMRKRSSSCARSDA